MPRLCTQNIMQEVLAYHYDLLRALHIIAAIAWMAGLLYLPRLFVYHTQATPGSETSETFKVMERRLLKIIMNPAMIATWLLGLLMFYAAYWDSFETVPWLHVKLLLVVLLTGVHHILGRHVKTFAADKNEKSTKYFRILNEVPTIIMIAVVLLAVMKPF